MYMLCKTCSAAALAVAGAGVVGAPISPGPGSGSSCNLYQQAAIPLLPRLRISSQPNFFPLPGIFLVDTNSSQITRMQEQSMETPQEHPSVICLSDLRSLAPTQQRWLRHSDPDSGLQF